MAEPIEDHHIFKKPSATARGGSVLNLSHSRVQHSKNSQLLCITQTNHFPMQGCVNSGVDSPWILPHSQLQVCPSGHPSISRIREADRLIE